MFVDNKKAKIQYTKNKPKFKYGIEIPCNYQDAICLDEKDGNTLWQDATALEMEHMMG